MVLLSLWSEGIGRGIKGAPITPRRSLIWEVRSAQGKSDGVRPGFDFIQEIMLGHLFLVAGNISSGIGTSSTVSSPSSRSRLGHRVLITNQKQCNKQSNTQKNRKKTQRERER